VVVVVVVVVRGPVVATMEGFVDFTRQAVFWLIVDAVDAIDDDDDDKYQMGNL
jgi:hypothetical protein